MLTGDARSFIIDLPGKAPNVKYWHGVTKIQLETRTRAMFAPSQANKTRVSFLVAPVSPYQITRNPEVWKAGREVEPKTLCGLSWPRSVNDLFQTHAEVKVSADTSTAERSAVAGDKRRSIYRTRVFLPKIAGGLATDLSPADRHEEERLRGHHYL